MWSSLPAAAWTQLQVKIMPFIILEQTTSSTEPRGFGSEGLYFSLLISSPFGSCCSSFKWENKMLFILGWSQWKDIKTLMGRNSFILNILQENVIVQHLLQTHSIFEAICCSRQGAVVNWVVAEKKDSWCDSSPLSGKPWITALFFFKKFAF